MLISKRVDYIVSEKAVAKKYIKSKQLGSDLIIFQKHLQTKPMYFIFSKNSRQAFRRKILRRAEII